MRNSPTYSWTQLIIWPGWLERPWWGQPYLTFTFQLPRRFLPQVVYINLIVLWLSLHFFLELYIFFLTNINNYKDSTVKNIASSIDIIVMPYWYFFCFLLGGYTRLPRCIRERIIPPPPISLQEKKMTLLKLNQVIEQRLVSSPIPLRMRNLKVSLIILFISSRLLYLILSSTFLIDT